MGEQNGSACFLSPIACVDALGHAPLSTKHLSPRLCPRNHCVGRVFKRFIVCVVDGAGKGGTFIFMENEIN